MQRLIATVRGQWMGALALFISLGGTAYAVATVTSADIVDGTISKVDFGARVVGPNALANVPNLQLWGRGANQPWYCGEFNDQHFAHDAGDWGVALTATRSRIPIPRSGLYLITGHMVWPRVVAPAGSGGCPGQANGGSGSRGSTRADLDPRIRITVYDADGTTRTVASDELDDGWDLEPDLYRGWRLNVSAVDRLQPGDRVALKCASNIGCGSEEDSPRMTLTWLGN